MTIELAERTERWLRDRAESMGLPADAYALRIIEREAASSGSGGDGRPLHEVIAEIVGDVPEEELAKLPSDGAENVDR